MKTSTLKAERTREYILDTAREISAARSKDHGDFSANLHHTYNFWEIFLLSALANPNMPKPTECPGFYTGMFMAIHKMSRIAIGTPNIDDFIDGTNYFAKAGELLLEWEREQNDPEREIKKDPYVRIAELEAQVKELAKVDSPDRREVTRDA